ncbi:unnamed protein product [Strongylus vulgaris]|uniref:Uncharacterized protein n=1 Tax=Strongylus vulgaris TaxID=40348 RepID=A0A3P7JTG4_STRVU|nr:unnamed protein product [Strongylus vulgaris]
MLDTRRSLSGLAQLMLPALVDSASVSDVHQAGNPHRTNLLGRAHQQIRRGAAGFRDVR